MVSFSLVVSRLHIDTTMVSPFYRDGRGARRGTAQQNGKPLEEARRCKERTLPELVGGQHCGNNALCFSLRNPPTVLQRSEII